LLAVAAVCCFGFEPPVPSLVIVFQWLPGFEDLGEDEGERTRSARRRRRRSRGWRSWNYIREEGERTKRRGGQEGGGFFFGFEGKRCAVWGGFGV
jgi:hypothetical protein